MYNPEQKQIILKNSFGVSYHVFYESGRGLCVRMLGDGGIWSRGYVLSELSINDFTVILDRDDIFHFVFQSADGRILYGHGRHGQIEIQPILNSKDTTPWMKHVSLQFHGDEVLFFYMVRYQKRYLLSMQTMKDNTLLKPAVIDYVDGPGKNYQAFIDQQGTCHLIYTNNDNTVKRLNHRQFNMETGVFSAPERITSQEHEIYFSCAVCIHEHIHLLYHISSENSYQVFYRRLDAEITECLYKGTSPAGYTGLVYSGKALRFFRVSSDSIYVRTSSEEGERWTDEVLYPFGTGISLTCFTYFTNHVKEKQELSCQELPGNFSRGYQLAFLNRDMSAGFLKDLYPDASGIRPPGSREEGSSSRVDENTPSSIHRNDEPKNTVLKDLQKKVLLLQNLTENMQRELTKLWLTQKGYEKKLDHMGRVYNHLKSTVSQPEEPETDELMTSRGTAAPSPKDCRVTQKNNREIASPVMNNNESDAQFIDEGDGADAGSVAVHFPDGESDETYPYDKATVVHSNVDAKGTSLAAEAGGIYKPVLDEN